MTRAPLLLALPLVLAPATLAQKAYQAPKGPGALGSVLRVELVPDRAGFTPAARLVDFDGFAPGAVVSGVSAGQSIGFRFTGPIEGTVWSDPEPRTSGAGAESPALQIRQPFAGVWLEETRIAPPLPATGLPVEPAFALDFERAVNRVGFDLRAAGSSEGLDITAVLSLVAGGEVIGTQSMAIRDGFAFVAIESTELFETLRLDLINPDNAQLSLDDLLFERDLFDGDADAVPDFADNCLGLWNPKQRDLDGDGIGDLCDRWPTDPDDDADGDGVPVPFDLCPDVFDPDQSDSDGDGIGDACDPLPLALDSDGDGIEDELDNCPTTYNPGQEDCDGDGLGDTCDPTLLTPMSIDVALARGESSTGPLTVCLPTVPPKVDVLIAFDTTGSMAAEISNLKAAVRDVITRMRAASASDLRFALVSFKDYPGDYTSCGYSATYGQANNFPFRVETPFGFEDPIIIAGVNRLSASGGFDAPESYGRVVWEAAQPDSGIDWRPGSRRVLLFVHDNVPHDCDLIEGTSCSLMFEVTGVDPGRDRLVDTPDDIDWHDALAGIQEQGIQMISIYSSPSNGPCSWTAWTRSTRGDLIRLDPDGTIPDGTNVPQEILNLIGRPVIEKLEFRVDRSIPLRVRIAPNFLGPVPVAAGSVTVIQEILVPPDLDPSITEFDTTVEVWADGGLLGVQTIHVDVLP